MHCKLFALRAKMNSNVDNTFVYCNSQGCRFHVNDSTFTQCSNPYVVQKHSDKHSISTVHFVEGCRYCNKHNTKYTLPKSDTCALNYLTSAFYTVAFVVAILACMVVVNMLVT